MTHSEKTKARNTHAPVFKKSLLAMCVVAAAHQGQVFAAEEVETEEVVVTGIRASLEKAQEIKKNANTVKDVVTASDISALPDKSVVEAISRIPGVSIERFAATDDPDHFSVEGSGAVVRGLNRVRSEFNGRDSFSANSSNGLNFSDVPAELMGGVEVVKNTTADLIEGGIAGTINLKTRKPFDKKELQIAGTIKATYADKIEKTEPDISGLISNVWDTDSGEFGVLVNASVSSFAARSEGLQLFNWYERGEASYKLGANGKPEQECPSWANCSDANNDGVLEYPWGEAVPYKADASKGVGLPFKSAPTDAEGKKQAYFAPAGVAMRQQDNDRDRTGFATSLQWESPDDTILTTLEYVRSESDLAWNERYVEYADQPFTTDAWNRFQFVDQKNAEGKESTRSSYLHSFTPVTIDGRNMGKFTHGVLNNVPYTSGVRYHDEHSKIEDISLNLQFKPTDALTLAADLQLVKSKFDLTDNTITAINKTDGDVGQPDMYLDLRGDSPYIEFIGAKPVDGKSTSLADPKLSILRAAMDHRSENEGDSKAFSFDATYDFDGSWIKSAKAGFRVSDKTQDRKVSVYNWGNISQEYNSSAESFFDNPEFGEVFDFGNSFYDGKSLGGVTSFWFPKASLLKDMQAFSDALGYPVVDEANRAKDANGVPISDNEDSRQPWNQIRALGGATLWYPLSDKRRNLTGSANDPMAGTPFLPSEVYQVNEKRQAVYGMLSFANDDFIFPVKGNIGARYVKYELESVGSFVLRPADEKYFVGKNWVGGTVRIPAADEALLKSSKAEANTATPEDFTKVLPSFNVGFEITDDLIVRFAASEAIWLPDLNDVRNSVTLNPNPNIPDSDLNTTGNQYINYGPLVYEAGEIGNPYLKPEVAVNLDLTAEWYFSDLGSLTFSLFNKDISDLHRRIASVSEYNGKPVLFSTTANVGDASVKGFEIAYQQTYDFLPGVLSGLGTQANYTYIDAKQETENEAVSTDQRAIFRYFSNLPLEGLSEDTANFVLFYEKEDISTRFAYNWRSDYLLNSRDVIAFSPIYNEGGGQLDFSFRYTINENFKVGFEANNLLDSETKTSLQYNQEGVQTPRSYFINDKRYALVLSGSF